MGTQRAGPPEPAPDRDPVIDAYKAGVDRSLLRANLALTPTERVRNLMALQQLAEEARTSAHRRRA
jgi:hypothetical protein